MNTRQNLLILGASTRAAAFSALRAGLAPRCVDFFADRDLAAVCPVERVDWQEGAEGLERVASAASVDEPFSPPPNPPPPRVEGLLDIPSTLVRPRYTPIPSPLVGEGQGGGE